MAVIVCWCVHCNLQISRYLGYTKKDRDVDICVDFAVDMQISLQILLYTDLAAAADEVSPLEVCVVEGEAGRQQGGGQRGGEDPVPNNLSQNC